MTRAFWDLLVHLVKNEARRAPRRQSVLPAPALFHMQRAGWFHYSMDGAPIIPLMMMIMIPLHCRCSVAAACRPRPLSPNPQSSNPRSPTESTTTLHVH